MLGCAEQQTPLQRRLGLPGAAPGTTVSLVGPNGTDLPGVSPCFDYQTLADLMDAKGNHLRRYYSPGQSDSYFILFRIPGHSTHLLRRRLAEERDFA